MDGLAAIATRGQVVESAGEFDADGTSPSRRATGALYEFWTRPHDTMFPKDDPAGDLLPAVPATARGKSISVWQATHCRWIPQHEEHEGWVSLRSTRPAKFGSRAQLGMCLPFLPCGCNDFGLR